MELLIVGEWMEMVTVAWLYVTLSSLASITIFLRLFALIAIIKWLFVEFVCHNLDDIEVVSLNCADLQFYLPLLHCC